MIEFDKILTSADKATSRAKIIDVMEKLNTLQSRVQNAYVEGLPDSIASTLQDAKTKVQTKHEQIQEENENIIKFFEDIYMQMEETKNYSGLQELTNNFEKGVSSAADNEDPRVQASMIRCAVFSKYKAAELLSKSMSTKTNFTQEEVALMKKTARELEIIDIEALDIKLRRTKNTIVSSLRNYIANSEAKKAEPAAKKAERKPTDTQATGMRRSNRLKIKNNTKVTNLDIDELNKLKQEFDTYSTGKNERKLRELDKKLIDLQTSLKGTIKGKVTRLRTKITTWLNVNGKASQEQRVERLRRRLQASQADEAKRLQEEKAGAEAKKLQEEKTKAKRQAAADKTAAEKTAAERKAAAKRQAEAEKAKRQAEAKAERQASAAEAAEAEREAKAKAEREVKAAASHLADLQPGKDLTDYARQLRKLNNAIGMNQWMLKTYSSDNKLTKEELKSVLQTAYKSVKRKPKKQQSMVNSFARVVFPDNFGQFEESTINYATSIATNNVKAQLSAFDALQEKINTLHDTELKTKLTKELAIA